MGNRLIGGRHLRGSLIVGLLRELARLRRSLTINASRRRMRLRNGCLVLGVRRGIGRVGCLRGLSFRNRMLGRLAPRRIRRPLHKSWGWIGRLRGDRERERVGEDRRRQRKTDNCGPARGGRCRSPFRGQNDFVRRLGERLRIV